MKCLALTGLFILSHLALSAQNSTGDSSGPKPIVIGETRHLNSRVLKESRKLNIYLPSGFRYGDTAKYQVIYLLDGGLDEDFLHVSGLVQFNTFPWIRQLPNTIVVGIANIDRRRDFTFPTNVKSASEKYPTTGHSKDFMDFIEFELFPFIDSLYPTNKDRALIGQSLGGLLGTEILLKRPYLFNRYILISPSLWWDNGSLLQYLYMNSNFPHKRYSGETRVYIGVGNEGPTPYDTTRTMESDARLLADQLKAMRDEHLIIYFDYLPLEDHATIGHEAVSRAFRLLFRKED